MNRSVSTLIVLVLLGSAQLHAQPISRLPRVEEPSNPRRTPQRGSGDSNSYGRFYKPAQVLAEVGKEVIFLSDVMPRVNELIATNKIPAEQVEAQRVRLIQAVLKQAITRKMLIQEFILTFPADKRAEMKVQIKERAQKMFLEALPKFLKAYKVSSAGELDAKLRTFGSSLVKLRLSFFENQIAQATVMRNVPQQVEVSFDELLSYYEENQKRYMRKARVRWEQLTVSFDKIPDRRRAFREIASMGNEIRLGGAKFSAVAKRRSHGLNASKGGYHDWVTRGSLASTKVDRVLFGIPPRLLSRIIEDSQGYHIVRVIEREGKRRVPFDEVQKEIKEKIQSRKKAAARTKFLARLQKKYPIWTIFDRRPRSPLTRAQQRRAAAAAASRTSEFKPR